MSERRVMTGVDESALVAFAGRLAEPARAGGMVHLVGELGAGKTTFARALLHALGVVGRVKSPTYSLIESYRFDGRDAHHIDLYRIAAPEELDWLGLGDLWGGSPLVLIEWPERGAGRLPPPDIVLSLDHAGPVRNLALTATTPAGLTYLAKA